MTVLSFTGFGAAAGAAAGFGADSSSLRLFHIYYELLLTKRMQPSYYACAACASWKSPGSPSCGLCTADAPGVERRFTPRRGFPARGHMMKPNQVDVLAFAMLGNLEQIDQAKETGFSRQSGSDVGETDGRDRIHFNFTFLHSVAATYFHARVLPESDAAGDFSATDTVTKTFVERHQ